MFSKVTQYTFTWMPIQFTLHSLFPSPFPWSYQLWYQCNLAIYTTPVLRFYLLKSFIYDHTNKLCIMYYLLNFSSRLVRAEQPQTKSRKKVFEKMKNCKFPLERIDHTTKRKAIGNMFGIVALFSLLCCCRHGLSIFLACPPKHFVLFHLIITIITPTNKIQNRRRVSSPHLVWNAFIYYPFL